MKRLWNHIVEHRVWSAVAAFLIASLFLQIGGWLAGNPRIILTANEQLVAWAGEPVKVPRGTLWIFGIYLLVSGIALLWPRIIGNPTSRKSKRPTPKYLAYKKDRICDIDWTWDWIGKAWDPSRNRYSVENLTPRCPDCQRKLDITQIRGPSSPSKLKCSDPECGWEWHWAPAKGPKRRHKALSSAEGLREEVREVIDQKVHTGEWILT